MKIDKNYEQYKNYDNYNKYISGSQKKGLSKEETKLANEATNPSKEKNINVQISDSTKRLVHSIEKSKEEGISERVESIRQAILQGVYKVDEKTIAKKIMDNIYIREGEKINE